MVIGQTCSNDEVTIIDGTVAVFDLFVDPYAFDLNITPLPAFDLVIPNATCDNTELTLTVNENNQTGGCIAADASYDWTIDTGSAYNDVCEGWATSKTYRPSLSQASVQRVHDAPASLVMWSHRPPWTTPPQ